MIKGPEFRVFTRHKVRPQSCRMLLPHICRYSYGVDPSNALHSWKWNRSRCFSSRRLRFL